MLANPSKFQLMFLGSKKYVECFTIDGNQVKAEDKARLLGVTIDNKLNFDSHVKEICAKASRQLNVLKRLTHSFGIKAKLTIFRCFVLSHFQYCSIVWHHCGKISTHKMEKIQERALRHVFDDHRASYDQLLEKANLPSLEAGRSEAIAVQTYTILNSNTPSYLDNLITPRNLTRNIRGAEKSLKIPKINRTNYGLKSFRYSAPKIWNQIPVETRNARDLSKFKNKLRLLNLKS